MADLRRALLLLALPALCRGEDLESASARARVWADGAAPVAAPNPVAASAASAASARAPVLAASKPARVPEGIEFLLDRIKIREGLERDGMDPLHRRVLGWWKRELPSASSFGEWLARHVPPARADERRLLELIASVAPKAASARAFVFYEPDAASAAEYSVLHETLGIGTLFGGIAASDGPKGVLMLGKRDSRVRMWGVGLHEAIHLEHAPLRDQEASVAAALQEIAPGASPINGDRLASWIEEGYTEWETVRRMALLLREDLDGDGLDAARAALRADIAAEGLAPEPPRPGVEGPLRGSYLFRARLIGALIRAGGEAMIKSFCGGDAAPLVRFLGPERALLLARIARAQGGVDTFLNQVDDEPMTLALDAIAAPERTAEFARRFSDGSVLAHIAAAVRFKIDPGLRSLTDPEFARRCEERVERATRALKARTGGWSARYLRETAEVEAEIEAAVGGVGAL